MCPTFSIDPIFGLAFFLNSNFLFSIEGRPKLNGLYVTSFACFCRKPEVEEEDFREAGDVDFLGGVALPGDVEDFRLV